MSERATVQLPKPVKARIVPLKMHPRQPDYEVIDQALAALERERREDGRPERRRKAS